MLRLADVIEISPDLVAMADSRGRVFYANVPSRGPGTITRAASWS